MINPADKQIELRSFFISTQNLVTGDIMLADSESKGHILVIDDDKEICSLFKNALNSFGYHVEVARNGDEAKYLTKQIKFDVAITDVHLPDTNGLDLIPEMKRNNSLLEIIVCTGDPWGYDFIGAVKAGASDWIAKPSNIQELCAKVERVRKEQGQLRELLKKNRELEKVKIEMEQVLEGLKKMIRGREGFILPERVKKREDFPEIIGNSQEIENVLDLVLLVANTNSTVLITGESGTGKELIARAIHTRSRRAEKPFVAVNCAALTESLLESELFGHTKGAFTGATLTKRGLIEEADHGTLFLDEMGETSPLFQVKLLRVLQEGEFKRVGASRNQTVDLRVIAATNMSLGQMIKSKTFREDLYYRINQFHITLPPLRDRIEDLPLLAQFFLEQACLAHSRPLAGFSSTVIEKMFRYAWPGNIRELENVVSQAVIMASPPLVELKDMLTFIEKLHQNPRKTRLTDKSYAEAKREFESMYLKNILDRAEGNISAASRLANMDRKQLRQKAQKLGILNFTRSPMRTHANNLGDLDASHPSN